MSPDMHWVFSHAQIGPTGWNYHEENLNLDSDYKQSPQEIIFQADLLSNFSWGSLSSTLKVPARLNSVLRYALSSLRCSDGSNRLELSWPLQAITTRNRLSSKYLLWNFSWSWLSSTFPVPARLNYVSRRALGILTSSDWANRLELSWGKSEFGLWLQAITNKKSSFKPTSSQISHEDHYHLPLKVPARLSSVPRHALSSLTCSDGAKWLELSWPNFNFDSDYMQSPQEIVFQANLLWHFSWRWLSSTFTVPARLNYVSKHALGILTCSDWANRFGIIMRKIWIWTLVTSNHHQIWSFKPTSSQISLEDHYHLLLKCLPGWVLFPDMRWVVWPAQMEPTGWNYDDQIPNFESDYKQSPQEIVFQANLLLNFFMKMIIIYFYSSCQVELCLQTCVGYSDMLRLGQPVGNYHEEHLNLDSDYKQSPQEIVFQADLLWNFSWGSLSSTFEVPARLNSVPRHALSSLRCSGRANRLELSWPNF